MSNLILVRHGQSVWNLEKRFTGWVDVDLTRNGELEATKAGHLIKASNINIDVYYSSLQLRAKNTLRLIKGILHDTKISNEARSTRTRILTLSLWMFGCRTWMGPALPERSGG